MTVTVVDPLRSSLVAVMDTEPAARPVTTPLEETVARVVSLELHVTERSVREFPAASRTVAVSAMVSPTLTEGVAIADVTVTDATAGSVSFRTRRNPL
jgi:hypothetical protein